MSLLFLQLSFLPTLVPRHGCVSKHVLFFPSSHFRVAGKMSEVLLSMLEVWNSLAMFCHQLQNPDFPPSPKSKPGTLKALNEM